MCSYCPTGMYLDNKKCKSCGCKTKGTLGCDPATGECICNTKAVSGADGKCEIYSCDVNSDCNDGICWRPSEMKKRGSPSSKYEVKINLDEELDLNKYSGSYILAPWRINNNRYWIKDDGTKAMWYCKGCKSVRIIIGDFSELGNQSGSLYNFGATYPTNGIWGYWINGGWNPNQPTAEEISVSSALLKDSDKGRCVKCDSCEKPNSDGEGGGCKKCDPTKTWLSH